MDDTQEFGFQQLMLSIVGATAKVLSQRPGETPETRFSRLQAATFMTMHFLPRDAVEAILASHCVMFHEVMVDDLRTLLDAGTDNARRQWHAMLFTANKGFLANLDRLRQFQKRPSEGRRDEKPAQPPGDAALAPEADPIDPAMERPAPGTADTAPVTPPSEPTPVPATTDAAVLSEPAAAAVPRDDDPATNQLALAAANDVEAAVTASVLATLMPSSVSREAIAACRANPVAMAALEAGDARGFAQALGIANPDPRFLTAAAQPGSPFDAKAWKRGKR